MPAGQSCAPGMTCTFTPALNNASLTISSGVFPLTVTASSSAGLNLDLSIPDLLQSDLSAVDQAGASLQLDGLSGLFTASRPLIQEMDVQTDSTTQFIGFTPGSLDGVTAGQAIVVKGPLLTSTASSYPQVAAIQVRARQH